MASVRFFRKAPPIQLRPRRSPTGTENFESPHQKFREKTLCTCMLAVLASPAVAHSALIETLYRENVSFRDRDLKRLTRCHTASENFDAELLLNIRVSI